MAVVFSLEIVLAGKISPFLHISLNLRYIRMFFYDVREATTAHCLTAPMLMQ